MFGSHARGHTHSEREKDYSVRVDYELRVLQEEDDQRLYRQAYNDTFLRYLVSEST